MIEFEKMKTKTMYDNDVCGYIEDIFSNMKLYNGSYYQNCRFIVEADMYNKVFYVSYDNVVNILKSKINIDDNDIIDLCNEFLEKLFKCSDYITVSIYRY